MRIFWSGTGMLLMILDAKTALQGAQDGIELCLRTVVPTLFPFFLLSILLTDSLLGASISWLRPLGRLLRIPKGSESLVLVGFIGGYPVGAQAITQAYQAGRLDRSGAHRLLGFCNNAGPSFIFGILGTAFSSTPTVWGLWLIHISSALLTAFVLPESAHNEIFCTNNKKITIPQALERSVNIMANVCGWIILFRVLISILDRWFLGFLPLEMQNLFIGFLELANGCCMLPQIQGEGLRFVMASVFLACGGICVAMQTSSVCTELGTGLYFAGKLLQGIYSFFLAYLYQLLFLPGGERFVLRTGILAIPLLLWLVAVLFLRKGKIPVAFRQYTVYN